MWPWPFLFSAHVVWLVLSVPTREIGREIADHFALGYPKDPFLMYQQHAKPFAVWAWCNAVCRSHPILRNYNPLLAAEDLRPKKIFERGNATACFLLFAREI
jgi:hypothetical protein